MDREHESRESDLPEVTLESFGPDARDFSHIYTLPFEGQEAAIAVLSDVDRKTLELYGEENALCEIEIRYDPFMNHDAAFFDKAVIKEEKRAQIATILRLQDEVRALREKQDE